MKTRYWVVAATVLGIALSCCSAWGYDEAADRKVQRVLEDTIVSFNFQDQPIEQVVEYLSTLGNVNIVLDRSKVQAGQTVTLKLSNVRLETALKLVCEAISMKSVIRDGVVLISDVEGTKQEPVTRVYDVLDIVAEVPDFEGPAFELGQLSSAQGRGGSGQSSPWGGVGAGTGTGTGTGTGEQQGKSLEERTQALVDMIKQVIAPGTWEEGGI